MSGNGSATARDATEQQAADYVLLLSDSPSFEARRAVDEWIAASPTNAVAFARAERAWEAAAKLSAPSAIADDDILLAAPMPRRRLLRYGAAAAVAGIAGAIGLTWRNGRQRLVTGVGEMRDFTLADGSTVHLNTDSEAYVDLGKTQRLVTLTRGEAFFDVAHNADVPFEVETATARVRVLGTAFNLRLANTRLELTVTDGLVGVRSADGATEKVPAGEGAVIARHSVAVSSLAARELDQRTAWRAGIVEFDGQSLAQAVSEFNRYRTKPIRIGDQRIAALQVGGRFHLDQADEFLSALRLTLPVQTVTSAEGDILLLYRPEETIEGEAAHQSAAPGASPPQT